MKAQFRLFLVSLLFAVSMKAAGSPPLTLRFSSGAITAEGVTAGAEVVFFGTSIERLNEKPAMYGPRRRVELVVDDDRDGAVRLSVPASAAAGIWAAADLSSGRYAVAATPGYQPQRIAFSSDALKNDNAGQLRKLQWPFSEMDVLLVRPRSGAWQLYAVKYSGRDDNRGNHDGLRIDVESLMPIGGSGNPPHNFKPGDILVVIDPGLMQYGVIEVGK